MDEGRAMSTDHPLPAPEEIQHKLNEFMKKEFGDRVVVGVPPILTALES